MPRSDPAPPTPRADGGGTRERILDVALDLFVEQGYDKTSLREIAEILGFSKAAVYYHFASKDEILLGLHLRLHELGRHAIDRFGEEPDDTAGWARLLGEVVRDMLANRKLLALHQYNHAALEGLSERHHHDDHDLEIAFRTVVQDASVPAADRIRLACALGAVVTGLTTFGGAFADVDAEEYERELRSVIDRVMGVAGPP